VADQPQRIKAIETRYAGCRFRSRLEARWAVFFDTLDIRWEYEREGLTLPSGPYLPDFWLPEFNAWVEIKGSAPTQREVRLAIELFHRGVESDAAGDGLIKYRMLVGDIPRICQAFPGDPDLFGLWMRQPRASWVLVFDGGTPVDPDDFRRVPDGFVTSSKNLLRTPIEDWELAQSFWAFAWATESALNAALTAARSARFEHGQHG
jgi:hypothetical protein